MKRFFARLLCVLLFLQGYPLMALQESGVQAVPRAHTLSLLDGWLRSAARETSTWADSLSETASSWWTTSPEEAASTWGLARPEELLSVAAFVADGAQGGGSASVASRTPSSDEWSPPLRLAEKKARVEKATASDPSAKSSAVAPDSTPRQKISKAGVAPEITALAQSLGNSPGRILRFVHDEIDFDPKWGAGKSPLGTLLERRGTSWDQAWLLQQLLTAAGVDARFEWGEIEITPELLKNVTGVDDPFRAGDLLTTAGVPIVLLVDGSRVVAARMSHVWVKAFLDYIPNRGATPGPGDKWIRMDASLKRFDVGAGVRLDEAVPFDLGEYLQGGMLLPPRAFYEEALQGYVNANNVGVAGLEGLKPAKSRIQEAFPFVPASLRGKILTVAGEATEVPAAFQQQLEVQVREAGGAQLLTWSTPWPVVYGKRVELAWPGATSADQSALDLNGGVFATPPYEVDLRPVLRVDGVEVASGEAIGSAEDVELTATFTPPAGSPMVAQFEMFAGEHAVLAADFGRIPQEVVDRLTAQRDAAIDPDEREAWVLALAGAVYLRSLSGDLEHLSALRYRRVVELGNVVLAAQRGAASRAPDGTPLTFSAAPPSLDLGSMVLGLFPADGVAGPVATSVATLELLGSQGSAREGEALAQALGGEHLTAVGFLTRAAREGQTLTRVDAANVDAALAAAELSSDVEASVRAGVGRGLIGWISEIQLPFDTWDATGYVLEDPATGAGGYFVTFERLAQGLEANIVFHSPQDLDVVPAPTDVVATLEGEAIDRWILAYRAADGGPAVELASGTGSFANATLARFDPTLLLNDLYDLVLTARDAAGQTASRKISVVVEGNMKIGNFTLSFVDLAVPVSGLDLEVIRTYDTRDLVERDFGVGWSLDLRQGSYRNNRPPGEGWQLAEGFLPCDSPRETRSHLTVIRLSEREVYRYALRVGDGAPSTGGGCFATARFDYVDGPVPGATLEILGNDRVFQETPSSDRVFDVDTLDTFEPQGVRLTTRDGRVFDLDLDLGVTRVEDPNGNRLEIREEGIFHSAGKAVEFERDAEGRITKITDPAGHEMAYIYDAAGDLTRTTDPAGNATTFTYDAGHRLVDIVDPRGVRAVRSEYDPDGRLVKVTDALGKDLLLAHDVAGRREVVTNRLGLARVLEYDSRGNVLRETDELGNTTTRSYDPKDRLLTETDPLDNTTTYAYDSGGDPTSVTDPLGNTTSFTYDDRGNPLTITDPRGKVTRNTYDSRGNLTSITDPLGAVTAYVHDARGQVLTETDAAGNVTAFAYDAFGNQNRTTDALGTETTLIYDANGNVTSQTTSRTLADGSTEALTTTSTADALGRVTATTWPDGSTTRTSYDPVGAVLSTTDALGRVTSFGYDAAGRQTETVHPDGTTKLRDYDAEGRVVAVTDRAGRVTTFNYDAAGRLITTVHPDGTSTSSAFDDAGRLIASTDARGNTTTSVYDAAGRRTQVIDALGHATTFAYDAAGKTTVTDALGHRTSFTYDDADRLVTTALPDGTTTSSEYDALGRRIAETDQAGRVTRFGYDPLGRLVQVTDAMGEITRYTYDEPGNRTSQTDANGHATGFTYNEVGRQTTRILPDGATESFAYDAAGNRIRRTDFNGVTTTYTYDSMDRLTRRSYPDGASVSFSYTATGRRATVTDARGVTTYTYDDRDRLIAMTAPEGWTLRYAWDASGNRTALTADLGDQGAHTTSYAYDALGRMTTVTDARGGVYGYAYDAAGRRTSLSYPNGVVTTYAHDAVGRLVDLHTEAPEGTVIQDYAYTLGPTGNLQSVTEQDATVRAWQYDGLYRLTRERVTDADGALIYENSFSYDPVGNRSQQVRAAAAAPTETLTYAYDVRDRLLSETTAGGAVTTYSWDANGNLVGKIDSEGTTTYGWDVENRLLSVELPDGTAVENTYDADGVQVTSASTLESGGVPAPTGYVMDTSGPLSQVIAEIAGAGALGVTYVRGEELLGLMRNDKERYAHADHVRSVRILTEPVGAVADAYSYEAFGELLQHTGSDPNPFLFTGEQRDSTTGLDYLRARWLTTNLGRFISSDPWSPVDTMPLTLNRYLYVRANPSNATDPSGLSEYSLVGLTAAVAIGASVYGGYSYYLHRDLGRAARDAALGALIGATFYASLPYVAPALWRVSLLGGGGAVAAVSSTGGTSTVVLYRAMSVAEYRQLIRTGQFSAGNPTTYETGKWFAERLSHAVRWGEILARFSRLKSSEWVVVEVRVLASRAQQFIRLERLDGIGPARYAELQQINSAVQGVSKVYPP